MGLWDKLKEANEKASKKAKEVREQHKQQAAELDDARGKKLSSVSFGLTYMGGYADYKKAVGKLTFFEKRTEFQSGFGSSKSFQIDNSKIVEVAIEGRHEVDRRVTVTRLVAFGIFAFAARKKKEDNETFVTIILNDGQEAIFHLKDRAPMEIKAKLAGAIAKVQQGKVLSQKLNGSHGSEADELAKFGELKEKGMITQEEYEAKKKQILGL